MLLLSAEDKRLKLVPVCKWKMIYMRAHHLMSNWALGRYTVLPTIRGHMKRVTAMDSNGNIIHMSTQATFWREIRILVI